ncbi:unnamed protein product [Prorocentrum cordatum]|uniref:Reverse transcriptase zinc-binding domain-containing protein n=1 Tax=Prorocentrum cordatum TaxID=2364126 RepID=A0ABN9TVM5_9DINO|nr:unnamed protein product [Polarella glacialis]
MSIRTCTHLGQIRCLWTPKRFPDLPIGPAPAPPAWWEGTQIQIEQLVREQAVTQAQVSQAYASFCQAAELELAETYQLELSGSKGNFFGRGDKFKFVYKPAIVKVGGPHPLGSPVSRAMRKFHTRLEELGHLKRKGYDDDDKQVSEINQKLQKAPELLWHSSGWRKWRAGHFSFRGYGAASIRDALFELSKLIQWVKVPNEWIPDEPGPDGTPGGAMDQIEALESEWKGIWRYGDLKEPEPYVKKALVSGTLQFCRGLEALELKVSRKKCMLVASDIKVGRSLQHSLREFSFKYVPAAKNLGVDFKLAFNKGRQVPQVDPSFLANALPLMMWCKAIFMQWSSEAQMQTAFDKAKKEVARGWRGVIGPAGAVVQTLIRLGWTGTSWCRWVTSTGLSLDLRELGPRTIKALLDDTTEQLSLKKVSEFYNLSWEPFLDPIRGVIAELRKRGDHLGISLLIAQVSGGLWTQKDLFKHRYSLDPLCRWCKAREGSVHHRIWGCDGSWLLRRDLDPGGKLLKQGINAQVVKIAAHQSRRAAFNHGVPPHFFHGNRLADEWAKTGAKAHPMNFHVRDRIKFHHDQVTLLARYMTEVLKNVHRLGYPDVEAIKERRQRTLVNSEAPLLEIVPDDKGHKISQVPGGWGCSVCGIGRSSRSRLVQLPCPGVPVVFLKAHPTHRLWANGPVLWCSACGVYAQQQVKDLAERCASRAVGEWKKRSLRLLKQGKNPSSPKAEAVVPVPLHR